MTCIACSPKDESQGLTSTHQSSIPTTGKVLAQVGKSSVTAKEFEAYLRFKKISVRSHQHLGELLKEYTEREAMAQAIAQDKKIDKEILKAELKEFRKEMLISRYFDSHLRTSITRSEIEKYYKDHASEYETRRVRVAHILMRLTARATDEEKAKKQEKIKEAHRQLISGKSFEEVAKALSEDRVSANRGGDMGWVRKGAVAPKFSELAFSVKPGSYSNPFETSFGFHILKVTEAPKAQKKPLDAVEGDIRYKLRAQAKRAEAGKLKRSVSIKIDPQGWMPGNTGSTRQSALHRNNHHSNNGAQTPNSR